VPWPAPAQASWLQLYAADLARAADGRFWVIADRTQAPSGAGYALENRVVMSRILPEAFRDFHVQRLASWFQTYRDTLLRQAPPGRDDPKVVLLTPGPYNETYFEHAYLARYLGLTLVQGAGPHRARPLALSEDSRRPERVDVLMRRVDDLFCDPPPLRSDRRSASRARARRARGERRGRECARPGLVETPALLAFLPGLCRAPRRGACAALRRDLVVRPERSAGVRREPSGRAPRHRRPSCRRMERPSARSSRRASASR
jgi:uncharacterized circularly permuted ATP-grasp superfamily protein